MEPDQRSCSSCGEPLAEDAVMGLCPKCLLKSGFYSGAASQPTRFVGEIPPIDQLATMFPQLELIELIGHGGMGAVYKARQPRLNRLVALKILARSKALDVRFSERFQREAQALARLSHPNIVTIYDFGEVDGLFYLLMEFVDGLNLRQLQQAQKITPEQALAIVPPICEALQFAHSHGIVHRDIKPENILLDKEGRVKIADFGIARILGPEASGQAITGDRQMIGTPHYMAPEQIEKPATVDQRADIYSLGVVFYEMLTGELPLGRFAPPSQKVQIDVRLDEVVLRALEKEPDRRYQQASEIKTHIETITTSAAQPAAQPHTPAPAGIPPVAAPGAVKPRLSRAALWGALWAPFFFMGLLPMFVARVVQRVPGQAPPGPAWWQLAPLLVLLPFALTAPFGTTMLGYTAISQIRRSAGRLYGLPLAIADLLLFPLLAMTGLIIWMIHRFTSSLLKVYTELNDVLPLPLQLLANHRTDLGLLISALLAMLIIMSVWRAANRSLQTQPAKVGRAGKIVMGIIVLGLLAVVAFVVAASVFPKMPPRSAPTLLGRPSGPTLTGRLNFSSYPKAEHIKRNNRTVLIHHDDYMVHHAIFYPGSFTSTVRDTYSGGTQAWTANGVVTLDNGSSFSYLRQSNDANHLQLNGRRYKLNDGIVFLLNADGTLNQISAFPSLAMATNPEQLNEFVGQVGFGVYTDAGIHSASATPTSDDQTSQIRQIESDFAKLGNAENIYHQVSPLASLIIAVRRNPEQRALVRTRAESLVSNTGASPFTRAQAIVLLGVLRDDKSVPMLQKAGAEVPQELIRMAAALALGEYGTPPADQALQHLAANEHTTVRQHFENAQQNPHRGRLGELVTYAAQAQFTSAQNEANASSEGNPADAMKRTAEQSVKAYKAFLSLEHNMLSPYSIGAMNLLALGGYARLEQYDDAKKVMEYAIRLTRPDRFANMLEVNLAEIERQAGDMKAAEQRLRRVMAIPPPASFEDSYAFTPQLFIAPKALADLLRDGGNTTESDKLLDGIADAAEKVATKHPEQAALASSYAMAAYQQKIARVLAAEPQRPRAKEAILEEFKLRFPHATYDDLVQVTNVPASNSPTTATHEDSATTSAILEQHARLLQVQEEAMNVGRISPREYMKTKFEYDVAAAKSKGDTTMVAQLRTDYYSRMLSALKELVDVGRLSNSDYEREKLELMKAVDQSTSDTREQ